MELGSPEEIIAERKRWAKHDAEMARLTNWEYFALGLWVGGMISCLILLVVT
jgi:hypothetical protein